MDERIIVAIDEDRPRRNALDWALARAARQAGNPIITLASVVEDEPGSAEANRALDALQAERARIERDRPGATIRTEVASGNVLRALTRMSQHADLLVVGTDKTGIFKSALRGSLGMRLATAAECSVAVVPEHKATGRDVVVGVDGTAESLFACEFAAREADAIGGGLLILCAGYVANPLFADLVPPLLPGRERAAILTRASEHVLGLFPPLSVQTRVVDGPPPQALLDASREAVLLVVGYHKRAKMTQLFEGSVGQDVMMELSVPVVVVHDTRAAHAADDPGHAKAHKRDLIPDP